MPDLTEVLRAVAQGRVIRPDSGFQAPHLLDGQDVGLDVRLLGRAGLLEHPISGPPVITPEGERRLAALAPGEYLRVSLPRPHAARIRNDRRLLGLPPDPDPIPPDRPF
jgi:hypothetical protein